MVSEPPTRYPSMVNRYGISLIGAGRLGRSLGRSLRARGWKIHAVVTSSPASAKRAARAIGGGHPSAQINCDVFVAPIILIAVPDSAIPQVVAQLSSYPDELRKRVVLHTSGVVGSNVLAPLRLNEALTGSIHPLQSFSGVAVPELEGRMFAVEGDAGATRIARVITRTLGGQVFLLNPAAKPLYHAAASMSAGHVLAIVESAIQIFASLGMKRREALRALLPLTRQVLENEERLGAGAAWTGPLARGDYQVISSHESALRDFPEEYSAAYRALNNLAARVLTRNPEDVLSKLKEVAHEAVEKPRSKGANA